MSERAGRRLRGMWRRLRYRGSSLPTITDTSVRDRLATLVHRALPQPISCWETFLNRPFFFLALVVWSAIVSCCRKTFFANTRLHVSSSVENRDVTLVDERKYIRLNVLPLRPGLRGRWSSGGIHLLCTV